MMTLRSRGGTTLIELIIFLAILSVVITAAMPMLFASNENRLLQQTIAAVEQNGAQLLDTMSLRIRQAQRVVSPALGASGSLLVLESGSDAADPIIVGVNSGALEIVRHTTRQVLSSDQVAVQRFVVRNTSQSSSRPSVHLSFTLSRTIRLQQPRTYTKTFETAVTLPPDDTWTVTQCVCDIPACGANDLFSWEVCESGDCYAASTRMECP